MSIRAIITEGFGAFGTIPDVVLQGFTAGEEVEEEIQEIIKTGTGGIDPTSRRRGIFKPTGTLHLPQKAKQTRVDERLDDSRKIQAEVAATLAREFGAENAAIAAQPVPIDSMSMLEIDREIGALLRKKLRTEEDELMMLVLMAAAAV